MRGRWACASCRESGDVAVIDACISGAVCRERARMRRASGRVEAPKPLAPVGEQLTLDVVWQTSITGSAAVVNSGLTGD